MRQRGHAVVEVSFLAPWIFFLFAGIWDAGFYTTALISTENAARVAALYTAASSDSAQDSAGACQYARDELYAMANTRGLQSCNALPLIVTATSVTGVDGAPASRVAVTYQTPALIPIPGLMGRLTVTRVAQMRVKDPHA